MRNNTPPKKKMIGTSASDLAAQARSAAARANAAKVAANAAKVAANAKKVKANAASVKATPKVTPKVTAKVTATKPLVNNKVKTATAVPTPRAKATSGKTYLIENDRGIRQYGTAAQADSATLSRSLWNPTGKEPFNPQDRVIGGKRTKQGHDRDMAYYANNPGMQKVLNNRKTKYEDLPNFVAPKNTGGGKLLSNPEFRGVTGRGGCLPGWSMDRNGRCVPKL